MPLVDLLDLDLAWHRVMRDLDDDPYPDPIHYADTQWDWDNFRTSLLQSLRDVPQGGYRPSPLSPIDIPKPNFTLRPAGAMKIGDRLVYQAIIDYLAPHFEPEPSVFSYRLRPGRPEQMFFPGVAQWKLFEEHCEQQCHEYRFVVQTDLAAYFELIDHRRLARRVDDIFAEVERSNLRAVKAHLGSLLRAWSNHTYFGIPQVCAPSSFIGNVYLDEFDKMIAREGIQYARYVDDMRLFASSRSSARVVLAKVVTELRRMGLYVSAAKTRIIESPQALDELDQHRAVMNHIDEAFHSRSRQRVLNVIPELHAFFTGIIDERDRFRDRHFRFCINRFRKLKAFGIGGDIFQPVTDAVLAKLPELPCATDTFAMYLSLFPEEPAIPSAILDFLESEHNIYPWQELQLLTVLCRLARAERAPLQQLAHYTRTRRVRNDVHPANRALATVVLGQVGDYADRRRIRDDFYREGSYEVRRSSLIAVQELNADERRHFYRSITGLDVDIDRLIRYLESLGQPKYHCFTPPTPEQFADDEFLPEGEDYEEDWY